MIDWSGTSAQVVALIEDAGTRDSIRIVSAALEAAYQRGVEPPIDEFDALKRIFDNVKLLGKAEKRYLVSRLISEDQDGQQQPIEN